jgi:glucose-1-phosphate thymidylyltransferase
VKGILLAGGSGTRLHPITLAVPKALVPVYDKPMIYYPLSVMMLAGIRDVLVISTPHEQSLFERLLGDGSQLGLSLSYAAQENPTGGIAEAFIIGADHVGTDPACLVLGDNIFHGHGLQSLLQDAATMTKGATLFGYTVKDPERYGVAEVSDDGRVLSLEEKPDNPKSNIAVTGLYFYDGDCVEIARSIKPSPRGQLEITDMNKVYVEQGTARVVMFGRGMAWLDTGTHDSLIEAGTFVQVLGHRQAERIACIEEIAWRMGYIDTEQLERLAQDLGRSSYGDYVAGLVADART